MDKNEIAKVLEEVRSNPEVVKKLREQKNPETLEEAAAVWAKAAAGLGYDLSEEEISAYIREAAEQMKRRTQEKEAGIENLSQQELEEVAGGKAPYEVCHDTYRDRENCWLNDGCDNAIVMYPGYLCHKVFRDTCEKFMG